MLSLLYGELSVIYYSDLRKKMRRCVILKHQADEQMKSTENFADEMPVDTVKPIGPVVRAVGICIAALGRGAAAAGRY